MEVENGKGFIYPRMLLIVNLVVRNECVAADSEYFGEMSVV